MAGSGVAGSFSAAGQRRPASRVASARTLGRRNDRRGDAQDIDLASAARGCAGNSADTCAATSALASHSSCLWRQGALSSHLPLRGFRVAAVRYRQTDIEYRPSAPTAHRSAARSASRVNQTGSAFQRCAVVGTRRRVQVAGTGSSHYCSPSRCFHHSGHRPRPPETRRRPQGSPCIEKSVQYHGRSRRRLCRGQSALERAATRRSRCTDREIRLPGQERTWFTPLSVCHFIPRGRGQVQVALRPNPSLEGDPPRQGALAPRRAVAGSIVPRGAKSPCLSGPPQLER